MSALTKKYPKKPVISCTVTPEENRSIITFAREHNIDVAKLVRIAVRAYTGLDLDRTRDRAVVQRSILHRPLRQRMFIQNNWKHMDHEYLIKQYGLTIHEICELDSA